MDCMVSRCHDFLGAGLGLKQRPRLWMAPVPSKVRALCGCSGSGRRGRRVGCSYGWFLLHRRCVVVRATVLNINRGRPPLKWDGYLCPCLHRGGQKAACQPRMSRVAPCSALQHDVFGRYTSSHCGGVYLPVSYLCCVLLHFTFAVSLHFTFAVSLHFTSLMLSRLLCVAALVVSPGRLDIVQPDELTRSAPHKHNSTRQCRARAVMPHV